MDGWIHFVLIGKPDKGRAVSGNNSTRNVAAAWLDTFRWAGRATETEKSTKAEEDTIRKREWDADANDRDCTSAGRGSDAASDEDGTNGDRVPFRRSTGWTGVDDGWTIRLRSSRWANSSVG